MVECSRLKVPYPHEDSEVCDRQAVSGEVLAPTFFQPSLQPCEIEWEQAFGQRLALRFLLVRQFGRRQICPATSRGALLPRQHVAEQPT